MILETIIILNCAREYLLCTIGLRIDSLQSSLFTELNWDTKLEVSHNLNWTWTELKCHIAYAVFCFHNCQNYDVGIVFTSIKKYIYILTAVHAGKGKSKLNFSNKLTKQTTVAINLIIHPTLIYYLSWTITIRLNTLK